jgi:signal transduction histidine kinase/ActR/RegA family two-component response regulator
MDKKRGAGGGPGDDGPTVGAREEAVTNRETWLKARERATIEHESMLTEREQLTRLLDEALRSRRELEKVKLDRERLIGQMRDANEKLVIATVRADELVEQADASRAQLAVIDRAKDQFLAMLGHELRNPLAPILAALDLMALRDPEAFERERSVIQRQVHHLVRLVDDLLDVSRIAGGKIVLFRIPVELGEIVTRAIEIANPLLQSKAHDLIVEVASDLTIDGDATRLTQAIANLVMNAAKYTPPRGQITIIGERRGDRVSLVVHDTGIGITPEVLPHVFELFAQAPQPVDRKLGGLGLGLTIAKTLITMHGGTLTAESDGIGHGSRFSVELPASIERVPIASYARARAVTADPSARRILVVDDNREAAELIAEALTVLGHTVRVAFDGDSALALVDDWVPEVVLLDIGLPVMDGYELARRMRELLGDHSPRFIAVTGYGQEVDHQRSAAARFAMHLVKPVDVATLAAGIASTAAPN